MARELCESFDSSVLSLGERLDVALAAIRPAFRGTVWVVFLGLLALVLIFTPSAFATLSEHAWKQNIVYGFPPEFIWYGCSTEIYGYYNDPSSPWYTHTLHNAGCASQMPGVSLASNAIEFYSDLYDHWYYVSSWAANFYKQPRQPGFVGAGSYDQAHFVVFGFDTTLTADCSIERIPS